MFFYEKVKTKFKVQVQSSEFRVQSSEFKVQSSTAYFIYSIGNL